MKLKTRFTIIIVGTFVVPILTTSLVMFLLAPEFLSIKQGTSDVKRFARVLDSAQNETEVISAANDLPDQLFIVIFDDKDEVVYRRDAKKDSGSLLIEDVHQQLVFTKQVQLASGEVLTALIRSGSLPLYMPLTGLVAVGSVLVFLLFLSAMTMRSINGSIKKLEEGTKRISSGDMDTPIVIHGDDTFKSLAHSFDSMRKKVKEENERRMRFFMGVSHDLKTPLSSIMGYSEALIDGLAQDTQTQDRYLKIIHSKGKLLDRRITQLIQYIKLTDDSFRQSLTLRPLVPFLQDFSEIQQDDASLRGLVFLSEINLPKNVEVPFSQDLLTRALENLVQNSFLHGDSSKPVRMVCEQQNHEIHIKLINHYKTALSEVLMEHMYEPFYREDQSRKGEGFGLGLASVKSIVESHGWHIEGRSIPRDGTTIFEIIIAVGS